MSHPAPVESGLDLTTRQVALPAPVVDRLMAWRQKQRLEKMGARDRWEEGNWLFTTWKGNTRGEHRVGHHLEPRWILTRLTEILKENGFEHLPVHGLRHSFATLLLSRNVPVKDMQEVLGHCRPSVTLDVYWQAVAGASDRVAGKAGEILFSPGAGAEDTDPPDASPKTGRVS